MIDTHAHLDALPVAPCHHCGAPTITSVLSGQDRRTFGLIDAADLDDGPWSLAPPDLLGDATCAWFIAHAAGGKPGNRWRAHDCTQPALDLGDAA